MQIEELLKINLYIKMPVWLIASKKIYAVINLCTGTNSSSHKNIVICMYWLCLGIYEQQIATWQEKISYYERKMEKAEGI